MFAGACLSPPLGNGVLNFVSSSRPWPSGVCSICDICPDAFEPHDAVYPAALNRTLSLQLESELGEEFDCGREVVNHDADVLHPLDRHVFMVTNLGSSRSEGRAFGDWSK